MQLITHLNHFNASIPKPYLPLLQKRFSQLSEDTDRPPMLILACEGDDITGSDFAFLGSHGLLSDLNELNSVGDDDFCRVFDWVSYSPELGLYEALFLRHSDDGYGVFIPDAVVSANPALNFILSDPAQGGLSPPQPL